MGCVLFKVRKRLASDFVNNYGLIVEPSFPFVKKLKIGKIKIIGGKIDHVFIKIPYNRNNNSKKLVLDCYRKLLDIISINEYKNVLVNDMNMSLISECCSYNECELCHEIYKLINDYIKDMDINVDIVINSGKDIKYYFD